MDDIRYSLPRAKKKIKHRLTGSKCKPDGTGTDAPGKRVDPSGSFPWPEPRVVASAGHDQGGNEANTDGRQIYSTDRGRSEVEIGEGGFSQRHLYSELEAAVGSRCSGEVEGIYPSTFTPQIPSSAKLDST